MSHAKSPGGESGHHGHHGHEAPKEGENEKKMMEILQLARAVDGAADPDTAEKQFEKNVSTLNEATKEQLLKIAYRIPLPDYLIERLLVDLRENDTADYSRINLTEVLMAFNFQAEHAVTHWRLAKIADAAIILRDEFQAIQKGNELFDLGKSNMTAMVFDKVEMFQANDRTYPITVVDPANPKAAPERINASLSDIAYFLDVLNQNRLLGGDRFSKQELLYNYFKGLDNPDAYALQKEVSTPDGSKASIDLMDVKRNPKDDYFHIKVYEYKKCIEESQSGLYLMSTWQGDTGGHREVSGQAYKDKSGFYVPVSGEIAQLITWEDMQKAGDTSKNLKGQPQELGDMDESATGAIIRFRSKFLKQRNVGNNANTYSSTPTRIHKAMFGFTVDDDPEAARYEGDSRVIYFGNEKLNAKAIEGIKHHYSKARARVGLPPMTNAEAADMFLLDVIAPCVLNNQQDWLVGLTKIYKIPGNATQFASKSDNEKLPGGITLKMMGKTVAPPHAIEWMSFTTLGELKKYIYWRVNNGEVEQDGFLNVEEQLKRDAIEDDKKKVAAKAGKESGSAEFSGPNYAAVIRGLLGSVGNEYISKFISGDKKFPALRGGDGRVLGPGDKRGNVALGAILKAELDAMDEGSQRDALETIFPSIKTPTVDDETEEEFESIEEKINEFLKQINRLSTDAGKSDREKLK